MQYYQVMRAKIGGEYDITEQNQSRAKVNSLASLADEFYKLFEDESRMRWEASESNRKNGLQPEKDRSLAETLRAKVKGTDFKEKLPDFESALNKSRSIDAIWQKAYRFLQAAKLATLEPEWVFQVKNRSWNTNDFCVRHTCGILEVLGTKGSDPYSSVQALNNTWMYLIHGNFTDDGPIADLDEDHIRQYITEDIVRGLEILNTPQQAGALVSKVQSAIYLLQNNIDAVRQALSDDKGSRELDQTSHAQTLLDHIHAVLPGLRKHYGLQGGSRKRNLRKYHKIHRTKRNRRTLKHSRKSKKNKGSTQRSL